MPSSFLLLLRQFVRVDRVFVRVRDTRFYHKSAECVASDLFCTHDGAGLAAITSFGNNYGWKLQQLSLKASLTPPIDEREQRSMTLHR